MHAEKVQTPISAFDDIAYGVAIQSDGKILLGGYGSSPSALAIVRYNADLGLDTSFDGDGILHPPATMSQCWDIAVQPADGNILAVGHSSNGTNKDWILARYLPDGSGDLSFGAGLGLVITQVRSPDRDDTATAVAVQADGKIIAAGASIRSGSNNDFAVARYNTDGSLDTTFNGTGTVTTGIQSPDRNDFANDIAIQSDGKIVIAGYTDATTRDVAVVRYNTDGSLDTTFNGTGIVTTDTGNPDQALGVAVQTDGRIVAAGYTTGTTTDILVVRYNANGTLDTTFNGTGIVITDATGSADFVQEMTLQPDGKILVGGEGWTTDGEFLLARYNTDGTLDATCGTGGVSLTDIGGYEDGAYGIAMQSVSQIVLGGYSRNTSGSSWEFGLVRYETTCVPTSVSLSAFEAHGANGTVELAWETASELNNLGFHLYRSQSAEGPYQRITTRPIPGLGSSPVGAKYSYRDEGLLNGATYHYKLEDIETTGETEFHGPVSATPSELVTTEEASPAVSRSRITFGDPSRNALQVERQGRSDVVLTLETHGFYAEPQDDGTVRLVVPGFESHSAPGFPEIPVKRSWVDAVVERQAEIVRIVPSEETSIEGLRPMNADDFEVAMSREGAVELRRRTRGRGSSSARAARDAGLYPDESGRVVLFGFQQETQRALVEMAPLRWDATSGRLVLTQRLVVHLGFTGPATASRRGQGAGRRFRGKARDSERRVAARLATRHEGLYGIVYEEVFGRRTRLPSARSIRLSRRGESVPYHIESTDESTGFAPGSVLYFLSEGAKSNPFGTEAVYELELDAPVTTTMETAEVVPSGAPVSRYWQRLEREENRLYQAALLEARDPWLWDLIFAPETKDYGFELRDLDDSGAASRIDVWLQGASDLPASPDHHVLLRVNGSLLAEARWDGRAARHVSVELTPGILREGSNSLSIENAGDTEAAYSMVMLDRFAVEYSRRLRADAGTLVGRFDSTGVAEIGGGSPGAYLLDVTEPIPVWLTGAQTTAGGSLRFRAEAGRSYLTVSPEAVLRPEVRKARFTGLRSRHPRAEYVAIGPRAFLPSAQRLLDHRRDQGLSVKAVAVEDIYDEFGFGESRPQAIRDFLSYAYHQWSTPSVRYVLLIGDATYDYKNYLGIHVVNLVPPMIVETSYLRTASDPAYASVHGDDLLPDLSIGRLPAASDVELDAIIEKILQYESRPPAPTAAAVLVADNPDAAANFERDAGEAALVLSRDRAVETVFLSRLGTEATRRAIVESFDRGPSLVSYIGHGGIHLWAHENIFDNGGVASLALTQNQPIVLTMNCLNGYFHFPYFDSLSEALLKAPGRGAAAVLSPSGLSLSTPARRYHQALLEEITSGEHERLGDAILKAQETYADTGDFPDLLVIYQLLGDPGLLLR